MSFSSTILPSSSSSSLLFLQSTSTSSDLHPPLRPKRLASSSSSSVSSNILSCINLVSILSVLINLVFCFLLMMAVVVDGRKTERIIESHHQHPVVVVDSSNRPRFRNGTLFQFGGGGGGGGSGRFRTSSQPQATSLDQFGNRILTNNNNDNNFVPGAVIHVSNRVNVLDTDSNVGNGDRTLTDNSWIHREDSSAAIQRLPSSGHQSRPDVIRYKVIKLDGGPNRTIVAGDQRFSHRTNLDAYHRAAAGLDDFADDSGHGHGAHSDGGGGGIVLEEFGRASSTASEGGGGGGHRNHVDISHDRFETGSIGTGGVSGGQGSLTGHQNRVIVGPVNRTLIRAGGLGGHGGHQNRIIVGPLNRTFIHDGPGGQTIHSIHRDRIINVVPVNRTTISHHPGSALGHQDHVIVARPLNRTLIHDSGSAATYLRADGGNRTFVHSGGGGNVLVHGAIGGGQQDHRTNVVGGAINRTSLIHTGSGLQNQSVFHHHHVGSGLNRTSYIQPGSTVGHGSGVSSHSAAINQTFPIHSGGYQNRTTIGGLNRTQIQSGSIAGSVVNAANNLAAIGDRTINLNNRQRFDGAPDRSRPVAGLGTAVEYDTRDRVAVGSAGTRTQAETERESIAPGTRLANIRAGPLGTSGQAVQLSQLDNVDIEAINKARIFADHANEEQAKKHAQNVVRLAATDQLESEIITNKTRAYLSCESGEMIVKINFTEPFRGVGYADYDRSSPCKFYGDGGKYYEMRIPLKGCGTKQEAPRIFINNIILRFHRSLELEEDEIKTIICRYPPPLAPPPPLIAAPILEQPPVAAPFIPAKLSELELLLIVSALLFLTLLLLGIGIGYYCLKKRKVKVVRKFVPPAEIPYFPPPSISSEEHSIISEQSVVQRDDYQFQNMGYIPEAKLSYLDDMFYHDQDMIDDDVMLTQQNYMVPAVSQFQTKKFDDRFVTQASETDIDTDFEVDRLIVPRKPKITKLITEDYFLTPKTTTEIVDEITTHRVVVPPKKTLTTKRLDDTFITPKKETEVDDLVSKQKVFGPPKLTTKKVDDLYGHSESETEVIDDQTKHRVFAPKPKPTSTIKEQDDYFRTDIYEIDEVIDDVRETEIHPKVISPPPTTRIVQTTEDDEIVMHSKDVEEVLVDETTTKYHHHPGPGTVLQPKPKITVQNIDDFYVTNITETETNEQITKIGRSMPNLTLQVDFEEQEQLEQEETTRTSHLTGFDVKMRTIPRKKAPTPTTSTSYTTTSETITSSTTKIDEVLKVLENPPREKLTGLDEHFMLPTRNRFRQVIITDETFRSLILESTTIEEYVEKIQMNPSYGPLFEPPTWNVIFRLLSLPEVQSPRKPRGRYSDTYRSGVSAHEVRSVTEEDVTFTRSRLSGSHYVPLPDYPMDDDEPSPRMSTKDKPPGPTHPHWASWLPDPRHYERHSPEFSPITPAFGATRYGPSVRRRTSPTSPPSSRSSGVFGPRRLENPYTSMDSPSVSRRRIFDYDIRPYSPDLDALSLEPSQTYLAYSGSIRHKKNQQQVVEREEREEIKSTTETNVYDWKRWAS